MMDPARERFELGEWVVDAAGNRLLRGNEVQPLRHKAMALLVLLARHPGQTVTRDEIVDAVWDGNRFVAPKAINTAVWTMRQALGDDSETPRYVETVAKKGYRLIAPVRPLGPAIEVPAPEPPRRRKTPAARPLTALAAVAATAAAVVWAWHTQVPPPGAVAALPVVTPLTQNPGIEYVGRLSPDGRQLAFGWWQGQGVGQLYLRAAEPIDAPQQQISGDSGDVLGLAWSPDAQAIAYTAVAAGGRCALWLYRLAERTRHELARCAPMFTPTVDWSPDGRWIAFSAEADGAGGLFLIAADGSGLKRLSTAPPAAAPDHQPAWSPDSRRLAFAREDPADGSRDLHEATLDGQVRRLSTLRLYRLHGMTYAAGGQDLIFSTTVQDSRVLQRWERSSAKALPLGLEGSAPALAADGRLVYALLRGRVSIARLAWGTAAPQRLITSVASDRSPDAAGSRTVFISRRSGSPELWLADGGGQQPRQLTRLDGAVAAPALSPSGGQVAFLGNCGPGKRYGLCLLDTTDGAARPLAADAASYGRPSWHPQAAEVWVASDRGGRWQLWRFATDGKSPPATVETEQPPGRALQWAADGSALVYQPRFGNRLQWRATASGAERPFDVVPAGESLVDWRWGTTGLVVLARGNRERFHRVDPASGRSTVLSDHALGTFPELATFTLAGDGAVLVEVAEAAVADLMQAR